jgi:hypothetical protein
LKFFYLLIALCFSAGSQTDLTNESTDALIRKLRSDPSNLAAVQVLAKRKDDPRVVPALGDAFVQNRLTGATLDTGHGRTHISQALAFTLVSIGVDNKIYLDELADYAQKAIAADPPSHEFITDSEGNEQPGKGHDPRFDAWCAQRGLDLDACFRAIASYAADLNYMLAVSGRDAVPIFREALKTSSVELVRTAVTGLARLDDVDSIPLIAQACVRFPARDAELIAFHAKDYTSPAVQQLFDRFIKDPEARARTMQDWEAKRGAIKDK